MINNVCIEIINVASILYRCRIVVALMNRPVFLWRHQWVINVINVFSTGVFMSVVCGKKKSSAIFKVTPRKCYSQEFFKTHDEYANPSVLQYTNLAPSCDRDGFQRMQIIYKEIENNTLISTEVVGHELITNSSLGWLNHLMVS